MKEPRWRIAHLDDLESPWGNAGGVVRNLEEFEAMARTGVGWIEDGSTTIEPREGHGPLSEDNFIYDQNTGETQNSLSMPNRGLDALVDEIPEKLKIARSFGKKAIFNVAPVSDTPAAETRELVERVYAAGAEAVLVNLGCPNVVKHDGSAHEILSYCPLDMYRVLAGLKTIVEKYHKVFVRTSPFQTYDQAKRAYRLIESSGVVSANWTPNTWPLAPEQSRLNVPGGGASGPAKSENALKQTGWAVEIFSGSGIKVVCSSGVKDHEKLGINAATQLRKALAIGAVAAAGSSFYFSPERSWQDDTDKLLYDFVESL